MSQDKSPGSLCQGKEAVSSRSQNCTTREFKDQRHPLVLMTHWHWLGLGDQWPVPFPGNKRAFGLRIVNGRVTAKIHESPRI